MTEPTLGAGLPAAADAAIALGPAAGGRDEDMLRRVLVVLGCWTLLSILAGLALAWVFRKLRGDGERRSDG